MKKNIPSSIRKYIRREKARIRREVFDPKKQKEMILKLRDKILNKKDSPTSEPKKNEDSRDS